MNATVSEDLTESLQFIRQDTPRIICGLGSDNLSTRMLSRRQLVTGVRHQSDVRVNIAGRRIERLNEMTKDRARLMSPSAVPCSYNGQGQ